MYRFCFGLIHNTRRLLSLSNCKLCFDDLGEKSLASITLSRIPANGVKFCAANNFYSSFAMSKKSAVLLLADGAEEMEVVITVDVLRRAEIDVTIASITGNKNVKCSRGVNLVADVLLDDATMNKKYDVVILPGGLGGSKELAKNAEVGKVLKAQETGNGVVAAICAAPTVLKAHGIGLGKQITSYPSMKDQLVNDYKYLSQKVVTDGNLITSQGPATAYAFGLAIIEKLLNKEAALPVAKGLLYDDYK